MNEKSKAVQEVAKTTGKAIEESSKLFQFFAKIFNTPLSVSSEMLTNKLEYLKWKQQVRLADKAMEILENRSSSQKLRVIPPKLAIEIIEGASFETDEDLHNKWSMLLANALDDTFADSVKISFTAILKSLDPIDAKVLEFLYAEYCETFVADAEERYHNILGYFISLEPREIIWGTKKIKDYFNISDFQSKVIIDNLMSLRLVAPYIEEEYLDIPEDVRMESNRNDAIQVTIYHGYDHICLTTLGISFIETCSDISLQSIRNEVETKKEKYNKMPYEQQIKILNSYVSILNEKHNLKIPLIDINELEINNPTNCNHSIF